MQKNELGVEIEAIEVKDHKEVLLCTVCTFFGFFSFTPALRRVTFTFVEHVDCQHGVHQPRGITLD